MPFANIESTWTNQERAGLLPEIILADDPRPVKEQVSERYAHGGGYHPMNGWTYTPGGPGEARITYVGTDDEDEPEDYHEESRTVVNDETIILFDCDFVAVVQKDNSFEVIRMD